MHTTTPPGVRGCCCEDCMGNRIRLTAELAGLTTVLLLILATPLAWWLARSRRWWREPVAAIAALPIVLPPTVLGFYLLIALGPASPLMALLHPFGIRTMAFTFTGLVRLPPESVTSVPIGPPSGKTQSAKSYFAIFSR